MENIVSMDGGKAGTAARRPRALRRRRGSSLAEMIIAIIVLAVVLISMMGVIMISRTAIHTKDHETAFALALRHMEELEKLKFTNLLALEAHSPVTLNGESPSKYTVTAVVSGYAHSADVTITVEWPRAAGGGRPVELQRVISAVGYKNVGEM